MVAKSHKDTDITANYTAPAQSAAVLTPDDNTDITPAPCRGLWIGGAGNISVDMANGDTVLFSGIQAGTLLPIQIKRLRQTNTTATLIAALW